MTKEKRILVSLSKEEKAIARKKSVEVFGRENISGYIAYLIRNAK